MISMLQWIITIGILLLAALYLTRRLLRLFSPKRQEAAPADCGHCSQDCSQCPLLSVQQADK